MRESSMPPRYDGGDGSRVGVVSATADRRTSVGRELVPEPAHRDEAGRVRRVALDLPADVEDVRVAGALVADEARLPEGLHDLAAGDGAARSLGEQREQPELRRRELQRLPLHPRTVAPQGELEGAHAVHGAPRHAGVELPAAQDRAYAAHELREREWLRDVVVGA